MFLKEQAAGFLCKKLRMLFLKKRYFFTQLPEVIHISFSYIQLSKNLSSAWSLWTNNNNNRNLQTLSEFVNHAKIMNFRRMQPLNSGLSIFSPISFSAHLPELEIGESVSPHRGPFILGGHSEKCSHGWFQRKDSFRTAFLPLSLCTGYQLRNSIPVFYSSTTLLCRFLFKLLITIMCTWISVQKELFV